MAGEIQYSFQAGATTYFLVRNRTGSIWNTSGGTGAGAFAIWLETQELYA